MNQSIKTNSRPLLGYLSFFTNGMLSVITAGVMNLFIHTYGFSYSMISVCLALQSLGNLVMVAISGMIIQKMHLGNSILLFCTAFAAGCMGILFSQNYVVICISMLLTGLGWGLCNNSIHLLINSSDDGSINLLHMSYAIGSFAGPFLLSLLLDQGLGWQPCVLLIIVFCILIAGYQIIKQQCFIPQQLSCHDTKPVCADHAGILQANQSAHSAGDLSLLSLIKIHFYRVCLMLYFIYIGLELLINTWLVNYLNSCAAMKLAHAQRLLSLFWVAVIVSRLFNSFLAKHIRSAVMLIIQGTASTIITILITMTSNNILIAALILLLGLFLGGISPCNALNARMFITGNGTASGILFAFGGLGSVILPLIMGQIVQSSSVKYSMFLIILLMLLFTITAITGMYIKKKEVLYEYE